MINNNKKNRSTQENEHYEYNVRRNGTITQKPTDTGYTHMRIKSNPALNGLDGVDNYSSYTTKERNGDLIYKFEQGNKPTGFNFADNAKKEAKAAKKAERTGKRKGTAFTLHDDDVADKVYRAIAGNSNVEYGRIRYNEHGKSDIINYIETDKSDENINFNKTFHGMARDIIHSHPFGQDNESGETNSKFPSPIDKNSYNEYKAEKREAKRAMPNHSIYHPVTPNSKIMPYYLPYNEGGAIEFNGRMFKNIDKETEKEYEKLYQDKYFGQ